MFQNIVIIFMLVAIWYLAQAAIYLFAKRGLFWAILEEGNAVPVMKNGVFHKMILAYTGNHFARVLPDGAPEDIDNLNVYNIEVSPNAEATQTFESTMFNLVFPVKEVAWVGFPGICELGKKVSVKQEVCELTFTDSELVNKLPYNLKLRVVIQITNPAKALFRVDDYRKTSLDWLHDNLDMEFRSLSEDDFKEKKAGQASALADVFTRTLQTSVEELKHHYGVEVLKIEVAEIDPANEKLRTLTLEKTVAQMDAEANVLKAEGEAKIAKIKADAEAEVVKTLASAEAEAIKIVNKSAGKMNVKALRLKELHAIEHAGANVTIIGSNLSIPPVLTIPAQKGSSK